MLAAGGFGWCRTAAAIAVLLAPVEQLHGAPGKGKKVEAVQKGTSTLYRTQVTGFASRAEASAFCDKLKAAGKNCFVK